MGNNAVLRVIQFQLTQMQDTLGQPEPLLAKYESHRNAISMTRQIFGKCTLANKLVETVRQLFILLLVQCTVIGVFVKCRSRGNAPL